MTEQSNNKKRQEALDSYQAKFINVTSEQLLAVKFQADKKKPGDNWTTVPEYLAKKEKTFPEELRKSELELKQAKSSSRNEKDKTWTKTKERGRSPARTRINHRGRSPGGTKKYYR